MEEGCIYWDLVFHICYSLVCFKVGCRAWCQVRVLLQDKERWSKDKFEIANKAKSEASRLSSMENEAAEKAKYVPCELLFVCI